MGHEREKPACVRNRNYSFFSHRACEYFPCHPDVPEEEFNCLFCYCPLYAMGENCGGNFAILGNGVKDCSDCDFPHHPESYDAIIAKLIQNNLEKG